MLEPVPLQIYLSMFIIVALPPEQVTPVGQYILALDGQPSHMQLPAIGQNILAFLHFLCPVA